MITSSSEGFSLTTIQAMACGVPVVATRCGGPEEIIEDEVTGMLVPPGSPETIAGAVQSLATDPRRRARFAQVSRAVVQQRYTTRAMLGAYEALYQQCLEGSRRRRRS